jgi:hypothetical protein
VAVIPPKSNRATDIPCHVERDKGRHLVENFFCKIKGFRRIATRYDKTDTSFAAMIHLVGSVPSTTVGLSIRVVCAGTPPHLLHRQFGRFSEANPHGMRTGSKEVSQRERERQL